MMRVRTTSLKPIDLDESTASNVLFELWRVARAARALIENTLTASPISGDEFGIYSLLCEVGEVTPSELERWMSAPPTTVSSHIKRLEARGHVSRTSDPSDGRSVRLRLTPAGVRAHDKAVANYLPALELVIENLGAKEPAVRRALGLLRKAIITARSDTM